MLCTTCRASSTKVARWHNILLACKIQVIVALTVPVPQGLVGTALYLHATYKSCVSTFLPLSALFQKTCGLAACRL